MRSSINIKQTRRKEARPATHSTESHSQHPFIWYLCIAKGSTCFTQLPQASSDLESVAGARWQTEDLFLHVWPMSLNSNGIPTQTKKSFRSTPKQGINFNTRVAMLFFSLLVLTGNKEKAPSHVGGTTKRRTHVDVPRSVRVALSPKRVTRVSRFAVCAMSLKRRGRPAAQLRDGFAAGHAVVWSWSHKHP